MANRTIPHRAVYAITCVDGRAYVGGTEAVSRRWGKHLSQLRGGKHHSRPLQEAWTSLGPGAFSFSILEEVPLGKDLHEAEQRHIDRLDAAGTGFNRCPNANSRVGLKYTDASRARMSAAQRGLHAGEKSPKAKVSESDVVEIRRLARTGLTARQICEQYGLSRGATSDIILRRNWKHVA